MPLAEERTVVFRHRRWLLLREEFHFTLSTVVGSGAAWFFYALMLVSLLILILKGRLDVIGSALPFFLGVPVLVLLTIPLTIRVNRMPRIRTQCTRGQLWLQTCILLLIILFATYRNIVYYFPGDLPIPYLYAFARWTIYFLGSPQIAPAHLVAGPHPPEHMITIPIMFFLIPLILLLLTGASWHEIGFGPGYNSWRVTLLWSILPILGCIAVALIGTVASVLQFLQHIMRAVLQSGFFYEFPFRGALMTRLCYLLRDDWGVVLSMLIYALFSLGYQTNEVYGDWIVGAASTILIQAMVGLGLAIIFKRTRNLTTSSIIDALFELFIAFT
jgi:hypothetical protein